MNYKHLLLHCAVLLLSQLHIGLSCSPCQLKETAHNYLVGRGIRCTETQALHRRSKTCYEVGALTFNPERGPCGENMVLAIDGNNTKVATCKCDPRSHFPLVYSEKAEQCYQLYSQGTCRQNNWLVFKNDSIACSPNPCPDPSLPLQVFYDGSCVLLNSKCDRSGKISFEQDSFLPTCKAQKFGAFALGGIGSRCPQNSYRTVDGRGCQEPMYFDFD